ncbi:DUF397 domain-containing protein, partial [Streptomyces sp. UNOC14_S4]
MPTVGPDLPVIIWCKSTYSTISQSECVEIASRQSPGTIPIRDSKT